MIQNSEIRILVVDDEKPICDILMGSLGDDSYQVASAQNAEDGLLKISQWQPQIVILDIWMPGDRDGLDVLRQAKMQFPQIEFIVMSGHGTIETAVKATKLGAWDFVEKPLSLERVSILIKNILNYQEEKREKITLLNKLRENIALIGNADVMMTLKQLIARVAPTNSSVLITGENGTGKEVVAKNIHYLSSRAAKSFVEVNCAAIPQDLIESELFGHEKGAFTGATSAKVGKFDLAHGGTIFLDEIGDMAIAAQAKILRVLQERNFERVGGTKTIEVDVRIVAATNKNLEEEIRAGRFREDLYHRLNVIPFKIPSLRERRKDIPILIEHFSNQFEREGGYQNKVFSEAAYELLQHYSWPGNVRELRNFVERVYILTPGNFVDVHDLRFAGLNVDAPMTDDEMMSFREARAQFEREFLLRKITENGGNISRTAEVIGLERSYLHRKIKSYGIDA